MTAVPDDLRRRFQKWDAKGRPSQEAFEWEKKNWQKYLGNNSILEALPNPIDRAGALETFKLVHDSDSALDAYIASYLWGYAKAGFGPYRAERVIRLNTDPEKGKHFAAELHTLSQISMADGGTAAFEHVVDKRQADRKFFAQWGPSFATKFISFATKASDQVATPRSWTASSLDGSRTTAKRSAPCGLRGTAPVATADTPNAWPNGQKTSALNPSRSNSSSLGGTERGGDLSPRREILRRVSSRTQDAFDTGRL